MAHAAVVDLALELLARQARADLLLERQPADARVLDPIDADRVHPLADAGQRDRQRVHREPRVHAGAEHRHLRLLRQLVDRCARTAGCAPHGYASSSVVDTIGILSFRIASICGMTFFSDDCVHSTTTSGFDALMAFRGSSDTLMRS